jgi:hypothetical protein
MAKATKKKTGSKKTTKATKETEVVVQQRAFGIIHEGPIKESKPEFDKGENGFLVNRMNGLVDEHNNPL